MIFPMLMFCTFTFVLPGVCVKCSEWLFSVVRVFPVCCLGTILMMWDGSSCRCCYCCHFYFYIPHVLYFYGKAFKFQNRFLASFLITFLSPEIAISINIHVPSSLSQIIMTSLLLGMVLLICTC